MFNTVPMFNTMPNLPAYWALGNRHMVTNFGGSIQHSIYPSGYSSLNYSLAQGFDSPNHISQWNPLLLGVNLGGNQITDPALIAKGNQSAYNFGLSMGFQSTLNSCLNLLSSYEAQISNILTSDKLTEAQKERLQAVLDEINELKERVAQASQNELSKENVEAVQGEVLGLTKKASETAKAIAEEVQSTTDNESSVEDPDNDDATVTDEDPSSSTIAANNEKEENEAVEICKNIYDGAIGCTGTDYDKIKDGINAITKDNVTAVLNMWQDQYQPQSGDDNMIETIFDEEMFWNNDTNTDLITIIVQKLEERAIELGVRNKLAGQFSVAYDELDDTFVNEGKVKEAVMAILETVTEAEAKADKKTVQTEKEEAQKTETENNNAKKAEQKKNEFRDDMREILGDDKAEVSEKVKYENNQFVVRIEGKNYYGKDYLELAKALAKAGYEPEKYLKKQTAGAVA